MKRLPGYLKRPIIDTDKTKIVRKILKENCLNTVCEGARCPNKNECYQKNTATFLIMGSVCTRNCRYCNIGCEKPFPLDENEPKNIAKAVKELGLKYVVITSVTRDDLSDGGAGHFVDCINTIRGIEEWRYRGIAEIKSHTSSLPVLRPSIELLTPDFKGDKKAIDKIIKNIYPPDVFNHNIETVERLFKTARPQGDYRTSLEVLKYVKENSVLNLQSRLGFQPNNNDVGVETPTYFPAQQYKIQTKSGLMVGLGETFEEIEQTLKDLRAVGCDIVTIGQYIAPSKQHLEVNKYYTLEEFEQLKVLAKKIGFKNYQIGPLVRSSYNASEVACAEKV